VERLAADAMRTAPALPTLFSVFFTASQHQQQQQREKPREKQQEEQQQNSKRLTSERSQPKPACSVATWMALNMVNKRYTGAAGVVIAVPLLAA
jgi:hypothetical protein